MDLIDSTGRRIVLEKELFRGGEGTIHPVAGNQAFLGKLYHHRIEPARQAKLAAMTTVSNEALLRVAAWPAATLHAGPGREMVGFLMPRFDGQRSELHQLYRPDSRKQTFRQADWAFLIHAARNVAAAVATVHAAGHVVGDVNQRNFIVGNDATVKVLDCDSFQICALGRLYHCPVGVPEFTPPELQNRVLTGIERTPNHDAFGLAVLIFQLLFMGRHPFAGQYLAPGDMPIERAITEGRFAFGRNSRSRQMEPPPNVVPFDSLPPRLTALFEAAFGGSTTRPDAKTWSAALDTAQTELRACGSEPMHKYYKALPQCPWCALEHASGVYFFIGVTAARPAVFDLATLWAAVNAATLVYEAPVRPTVHVAGTPVAGTVKRTRRLAIAAKVATVLFLGPAAVAWPQTLAIVILAFIAVVISPLPGGLERKRRVARLHETERAWHQAYKAAEAAVAIGPLLTKQRELERLKQTYEGLDREKRDELEKLTRNSRQIQLDHYLQRHRIRAHDIADIGPKRKATLAAWGIHTAADITWQSVGAVQGFGPMLRTRLMAWRAAIESKFVFDPTRSIPKADLDAVDYRWHRRKTDLQQQLRTGAEGARRISLAIRQRRVTVANELLQPALSWAQARADVDVVNAALSFRTRDHS